MAIFQCYIWSKYHLQPWNTTFLSFRVIICTNCTIYNSASNSTFWQNQSHWIVMILTGCSLSIWTSGNPSRIPAIEPGDNMWHSVIPPKKKTPHQLLVSDNQKTSPLIFEAPPEWLSCLRLQECRSLGKPDSWTKKTVYDMICVYSKFLYEYTVYPFTAPIDLLISSLWESRWCIARLPHHALGQRLDGLFDGVLGGTLPMERLAEVAMCL